MNELDANKVDDLKNVSLLMSNVEDQDNAIAINQVLELEQMQFPNRDSLLESVRSLALLQGYATSIKNSKLDRYVTIGCDRGGTYRCQIFEGDRKRKTATRLINCPFEVKGRRQNNGSWKIEIVNLTHNHEPSLDMSGHPSCRRFSQPEVSRIKEMIKARAAPRQILSVLRQDNLQLQATSRTVYNMKAKIFNEYLGDRTMIQALLEELAANGFLYNIEYDEHNRLTYLFFAHPASITLTKSYSNVFVMDCTYKTNRYKMPLLDIVGVSSFNSSFYSCFVFMRKEEKVDYIWALKMFSNLLGASQQPLVIITDRELALMNAIEVVFPNTVNLLCILDYIRVTWLPLKEHFVAAWTDKYSHFGNRVTSRAEGAHASLKKYLQVSTGDLCQVRNKICLAIDNQFQEIKAQLSSEKIRAPHRFRIPLFKELIGRVSHFALDKILEQYEKAKSELDTCVCKGQFMIVMGLLCSHKIKLLKQKSLHLDDIHPQWRLDIRSFLNFDMSHNSEDDRFAHLVKELKKKNI